jgi:glycine/serine hydroxymethyltransferase
MTEPEMLQIAEWIAAACREGADLEAIGAQVRDLCLRFPIPSGLVERG